MTLTFFFRAAYQFLLRLGEGVDKGNAKDTEFKDKNKGRKASSFSLVHRHLRYNLLSCSSTFSADIGKSLMRTPVTRAIALATAGAMPNTDISPTPFAP